MPLLEELPDVLVLAELPEVVDLCDDPPVLLLVSCSVKGCCQMDC